MNPQATTGDSPDHPAVTHDQSVTIPLLDKAARVDGHWQPRVIAEMNDYQFKVAKLLGDFVWHSHADTDETFLVLEGEIVLRAGEMAVVPRGVDHKPHAAAEVRVLLIEPRGVVNTGDGDKLERTAPNDVWI
ncbi:MAG: cupin domain-containing protein [Burkholderia gladioli]